ncbi:hypothetical protein [Nostoc sp. MG11]|uniref:hypothetical protein n=1 Tax=Nostoc sp. MG11 TaxID=2721166 RepID=UPI0018695574|nr:hypothetical protein [Nostoc sp. MG11]
MKVSAILKGSVCLLGLVGAGGLLAEQANADQAAARASASVTRPGSVTESLSGEVLLPTGYYFNGTGGNTLTVTPSYNNPGTTNQSLNGLAFNAGTPVATNSSGTIAGVVIDMLQGDNTGNVNAATIDDAAAIIKAAAGADGLE